MENNILILSIYKFPNGDAGSVRQYSLSKLFQSIGWNPFIIGMGQSTHYKKEEYNSIEYMSFRNSKNNIFSRLMGLINYKKRLKQYLKENQNIYSKILVVDIPFTALFFVKKFAIKNNISLLHDSVEWYSPEQFTYRKLSISYILKNLYNTHWIDKTFKVIAISKYLEAHFSDRGCNTIRIPAILDVKNVPSKKHINPEKLTIIYAGSPGRKDYLKEIVEGINKLEADILTKIEFRIIGASKDEVEGISGISEDVIQRLQRVIVYKGRVSREEVLKNLEEADFTVLMRSPNQRYAKAGFPTKVVESLASGTPVICNITSDLDDYIHDCENGIIVKECTPEAFSLAIKRALDISIEERRNMYEKARQCAEECFDYKLYENTIKHFI